MSTPPKPNVLAPCSKDQFSISGLVDEVSEESEQVQQIETTAPAISLHELLGAGQGLGAYSEVRSVKRRGLRRPWEREHIVIDTTGRSVADRAEEPAMR